MFDDDYEDLPPTHLRPWTFTRRALRYFAGCLMLLGCPLVLIIFVLTRGLFAH